MPIGEICESYEYVNFYELQQEWATIIGIMISWNSTINQNY